MEIFNLWWIYVALYLLFSLIFNQLYKLATKKCRRDTSLVLLSQIIAGVSVLLFCPLFEFEFPTDWKTYILLGVTCILYAITDRSNGTVRRGIEASTYNVLKQLSTVFMTVAGLVFFKEPFVLTKGIGTLLIIVSNIFVFYEKGEIKFNKYMLLGLIANIAHAIALTIEINNSRNFNLPIYVSITLVVPAIIIFIFERNRMKQIKRDMLKGDKGEILVASIAWGLSIMFLLRAYQLGEVTKVAPLSAVAVILNLITGYIFLKERKNLARKLISAGLIVISVLLINIAS